MTLFLFFIIFFPAMLNRNSRKKNIDKKESIVYDESTAKKDSKKNESLKTRNQQDNELQKGKNKEKNVKAALESLEESGDVTIKEEKEGEKDFYIPKNLKDNSKEIVREFFKKII